jgi:hypothetical protein
MLPGRRKYYRLDLAPETVKNGNITYTRHDLHEWSPERIFAQDDLYTTKWGDVSNTEIEQLFFGEIDDKAAAALDFFETYDHTNISEQAFNTLMPYMSVQKLRTPKGLAWLSQQLRQGHNLTLIALQQFQTLFCAIWTECVWQIADASESPTKFIISDHPVVVYNRACPPLSKACVGTNDPDIRQNATHTYFPLSLNKILILTNLNWVRNPYQSEIKVRPNSSLFRHTIFNFQSIQIGRLLTEDEVLQINFVTKKRAKRYIAAAEKEWLYPEHRVSTDDWKKFGDGYLFMPEPRLVYMGGEVTVGYKDGGADAWSEYGHKPWQRGFKDKQRDETESAALERFKAEWALRHGARHAAYNSDFGRTERHTDSDDMMQHYKTVMKKYRRR